MILEGVTTGGAVVPVEVTPAGRLVAEGLTGPTGPAGPAGPAGPVGSDNWARTGTELSPKTAGDSVFTSGAVKVGGTTAAPNIRLNANGEITSKGSGNNYASIETTNAAASAGIKLKGPGSATYGIRFDSGNNLWLGESGLETVVIDSSHNLLIGQRGGTLPASPNITLKADGEAIFNMPGSTPVDNGHGGFALKLNAPGTAADAGTGISFAANTTACAQITGRRENGTAGNYAGYLSFDTMSTTGSVMSSRARITSGGNFLLGGTLPSAPNIQLKSHGEIQVTGALLYGGGNGSFSRTAGSHVWATAAGHTISVVAGGAGGVLLNNTATAWTPATSESRLKDIQSDADTDQCWTLIRDIELKRYYYKDQDDKSGVSYMGPMADWLGVQDPELLIDTGRTDEDGKIHTYNQGLLDMKALAALSAALKRIEALEAEVAALKAASIPTP